MADQILVQAKPRDKKGSGGARSLRRDGALPAVVYGDGKDGKALELNEHDFEQILRHHASEHLVMDLQVGKDKPKKVLLKEVQHHPVTGRILHADFHEISMTKKLRVAVPVELLGEPEGVSQQGGVLEHLIREIEIECLPADIPEQVQVDVAGLHIGENVTVESIVLPQDKYLILTAPDVAVAAVAAPRVVEEPVAEEEAEEAEAAEAGEGAAEPEVIGEKKEDEAAEEEK